MYFNKLGTTEYNGVTIPDILKRISIVNGESFNVSNFVEQYTIGENETPENVAYNYYNNVEYYWIIIVLNNIKSRFFDWPLSTEQFGNYIEQKYRTKISLFFEEGSLSNFVLCKTKFVTRDLLNETVKYKVLSCDRNLNKLEIEKPNPASIINTSSPIKLLNEKLETIATIIPRRVVLENEYAVHHFDYMQNITEDVIQYNSKALLEQYISGITPINTVTNLDYETNINENKRNIILLKKQHISNFITEFSRIGQLG